jgi:hypothetical protein
MRTGTMRLVEEGRSESLCRIALVTALNRRRLAPYQTSSMHTSSQAANLPVMALNSMC